jgi:S1-C subfamily serine protease
MKRAPLADRFSVSLSFLLFAFVCPLSFGDKEKTQPASAQLPAELQGAKIYRLPDDDKSRRSLENPIIYRGLAYEDINLQRLVLNLSVSVRPMDRAATVNKIYFQDIRVNGVPVQVETFNREFRVSKKDTVDLPMPLKCTMVFSDLESLAPLKEIVHQDKLTVTGQSFIEVKLSTLQKIAVRARRLVLPVEVKEEVPLQMFSGNPWLKLAANGILDTLTDPASEAAVALAKEHLSKLTEGRALEQKARSSLYFLYCEYALRDPKTGASEKFSQSGTGFVVSADGKMLTAKRVVEPWAFDPQTLLLITRDHLEVDRNSLRLAAWPAGATILTGDGTPDFASALATEKQTLRVLRTAPDRFLKAEFQDPDSGEKQALEVHAGAESDVALLQASGGSFQPLEFVDPEAKIDASTQWILMGFPFGLSQTQANPKQVGVKASVVEGAIILDPGLQPGQAGAPLVTAQGKVLALCTEPNRCVAVDSLRRFIP